MSPCLAFSWTLPAAVWGLVVALLALAAVLAAVRGLLNRRDDRAAEAARADANVAAHKRNRGVGGRSA